MERKYIIFCVCVCVYDGICGMFTVKHIHLKLHYLRGKRIKIIRICELLQSRRTCSFELAGYLHGRKRWDGEILGHVEAVEKPIKTNRYLLYMRIHKTNKESLKGTV